MNAAPSVTIPAPISIAQPKPRPLWLVRLLQYEYWPFYIFFAPMVIYYVYMAIRSRSLTFFTAVNPSIRLGGLFGESKSAILATVPAAFRPQTLLIGANASTEQVLSQMTQQGLSFPVVCKPDVGERGEGVRVITSKTELSQWLLLHPDEPFLVQEWVAGPLEFGVFYYRMPNGNASGVTSVVQKEFLTVTGNGYATIRKLLEQNERARMTWNELEPIIAQLGNQVPASGETVLIQPIGNHCRGTKFLNANHLRSSQLTHIFDQIAAPMAGFDYGRFDIRVPSVGDLLAGRNIRVLEVNGVTSEPGHIYDPDYSLWRAYADIAYHVKLLYRISEQRRKAGTSVASARTVLRCLYRRFGSSEPSATHE
ncbi:hypothetical protein WBJ53_20925 [Spirosoma sp. SC4-14]|uniref:hypothetical protein n=1 Tax=Spirosoma sp. SC4-14 TaxID=3128900 RepID=UPI0030D091B6